MQTLPYRIAFLAPKLALPPGWERVDLAAAELLEGAVFEHLVRHPRLSVTDPDDTRRTDPSGKILDIAHPDAENEIQHQLYASRRDEVLWFEVDFVAPGQSAVRLKARRYDSSTSNDYSAVGGPLSGLIAGVVEQWLTARGFGPSQKPIESFADGDLLSAAHLGADLVAAAQQDIERARTMLALPERLKIPYCHLAGHALGIGVERTILDLEPDNPWGLRDDHLARWHSPTSAPRDDLKRIVAIAPGYSKPWGLMWGKGVENTDRVYWYSINAALAPANPYALGGYADALRETGRRPEAFRLYERATRLFPTLLTHHNAAMQVSRDYMPTGVAYLEAIRRMSRIDDLLKQGVFGGAEPDMCMCRLALSDAFFDLGRLAEATNLRDRALSLVFNPNDWPKMRAVLEKWKSDPVVFAQAYAREAYFRGDFGRAIKGSPKGEIDDFTQLSIFVESLLRCDKDRLALLAFAHYSRRTPGSNVGATLSGALAFLSNGLLGPALEIALGAELRTPQHPYTLRIDRVLRLSAAFDAQAHDAIVASWVERGAITVATRMARNSADFVPGAATQPTIGRLLSAMNGRRFDAASLASLRAVLSEKRVEGTDAIDVFFGGPNDGSLATTDRLVSGWPSVAPRPTDGADEAAQIVYTGRLVYVLANALARYLAAAGAHPGPIAGAWKTIANEALAAMSVAPLLPSTNEVRGLFAAIEPYVLGDLPAGDAFVMRIERLFELEEGHGAHVAALIDGLPDVASLFRGDEANATELRTAQDAAKAGDLGRALTLYPRILRAVGGNFATAYADVVSAAFAKNQLSGEATVDALFVAYAANPSSAGAAVELAKILLPRNPKLGFEVVAERLGWASGDWKKRRLEMLAPLWPASLGIPFAFDDAASKAYLALQQGKTQEAIDLYRWCDALDAGNQTVLRNLGLAYAQLGDAFRSVAVFGEADAKEGPLQAAQQLFNSGKTRQAARVFEYACLGNVPVVAFQQWAGAGYAAEDDEIAGEAYDATMQRTGGRLDGPSLNAYAGVLDNLGRYDDCEAVARTLLEVGANDATLLSSAWHHYACSLLGRGRFQEGADAATRALSMNPPAENLPIFQETLERCRTGQARPVTPSRASTPVGRAFKALLASDMPRVTEIARADANDLELQRAALAASEFRTEAENDVRVTDRCREAANAMLSRTEGATDPHAVLARLDAMRIRERMIFPIDPVPKMGPRPTDEELERLFPSRPAPGQAQTAMGDPDPEVLPGTKLAKLSQYVALMKGMQGGDFQGALNRAGLDMGTYAALAGQWGQKMTQDPTLAGKFQQMMSQG